jgi:hypothetical protein
MNEKTVVALEIRYSDGSRATATGDDAETIMRWCEACEARNLDHGAVYRGPRMTVHPPPVAETRRDARRIIADAETDREWTQAELRAHLIAGGGWNADAFAGEMIPQGVKYIDFSPPTEADFARAKQLLAEHPEWSDPEWLAKAREPKP